MGLAHVAIEHMAFEIKRVESAPILDLNRAVVTINPALEEPLKAALYSWDKEFIVFLKGTKEGRYVHVDGIHVPEQWNTATECESIPKFDPDKWLGILHSHVAMGAWHSCTDAKGVDMAPVSLVISRTTQGGMDIVGKVGVSLPCGCIGVMKAEVSFGVATPVEDRVELEQPAEVAFIDAVRSDCQHVQKGIDWSLYNAIAEQTKPAPVKTYPQGSYTTGSNGKHSAYKQQDDYSSAVGYGGWGQGDWAVEQCNWCSEWEDVSDMHHIRSGKLICEACFDDIPKTAVIAQ